MSNKQFYEYFEIHTQIKLEIYNEYLKRYLPILLQAGSVESIYIYDMFCGKGFTSGGQKGSAVLGIEEVIDSVSRIGSRKKVHICLSDSDKDNCLELQQIVNTLRKPGNIFIDVSCKEFHEAVDDSNNRHGGGRVNSREKILYFIDPYGYKNTDPKTILDIKQNDNAEVMLFVPVRHIFRFLGSKRPSKALDKWRQFLEYEDEISDISEMIKDICVKFTRENFKTGYFTLTNQTSGNEYALFFLSSNLLGLEKFNEVKWSFDKVQGRYIDKNYECSVASCIGDDLHKNELCLLKNSLLQEIRSLPNMTISNVDLYEFIIQNGYLPKHFNLLWKEEKFLKKKFTTERKRGNYLNYGNYIKTKVLALFSI